MARLRYTTFDGVVHSHELRPGTTRIGRTPDNDLQIDELAVSSQHCSIRFQDGIVRVRDLASIAGTYVEGEPVTECEIKPGQVVGLGTFLLFVENSDQPDRAPSVPGGSSVPLPDGSYSCLRHGNKRALFECADCFDLSCEECVSIKESRAEGSDAICPACGGKCRAIDWSGLTMTRKDAAFGLLPSPVKRAWEFWEKHRSKKAK